MGECEARTQGAPIGALSGRLRTTHRADQRGQAARASSREELVLATVVETRPRRPAQSLPCEDRRTRQGERDRDDEEEEAGRECRVGSDMELAEEADEESLADCEPVDGE